MVGSGLLSVTGVGCWVVCDRWVVGCLSQVLGVGLSVTGGGYQVVCDSWWVVGWL